MNTPSRFPFYIKAPLIIIGLFVFIYTLSIAQDIILPLIYAVIIAIAVSPMVNLLVRNKINRTVAIAMVLVMGLLISTGLVTLLASQTSLLSEAWPALTNKFEGLIKEAVLWASGYFNISVRKVDAWVTKEKVEALNNGTAAIGHTLSTMGGVLAGAFLTPVYIFMILFYQPHLVMFIHKLCGVDNDVRVSDILAQTKAIIQSYLAGLFAEFAIVAAMNSIGLLILGIPYAILLGIVGSLLNVIPYLGGMIAVLIFMTVALVTKAPVYVLYVFALYTIIQFIDNNYIVPKIVGSKVKLNALICIIGVIAGAALWGIPGMFLAIPLTAIIKLIFDRIDSLKPWGFLLGDTTPEPEPITLDFIIKGFVQSITTKKT
jgi:predicted PurR-regulated permease PerM